MFGHIATILLLFRLLFSAHGLPDLIRIGGLFDTEDEEQELAFRIAVDWINSDPSLLPDSRLIAQVEKLEPHDSYKASKQFCGLLQAGIAAVFGPQSELTSMHVQSICDALEIPHVIARWEYRQQRDDLSVNIYPHPRSLSKAFVQLIDTWGWKEFYFVYQENEGVIRLQDLLKESELRGWYIRTFQLGNNTDNYRDTFWEVKLSPLPTTIKDDKVEHRIVLDVPRINLYDVLKSAQQVGMVTEKQGYIITSLDVHATDMEDFQYSKTNITALRLIQEDSIEFKRVLSEVNKRLSRTRNQPPRDTLRTESALMFDMVKLFAMAIEAMDVGKDLTAFPPVSCNQMNKAVLDWNKGSDGTSLVNYMKNTLLNGITGQVRFDSEGYRASSKLDIMHLNKTGLVKVGSIGPGANVNITLSLGEKKEFYELENKNYIITTILNQGFVMYKESSKKMVGNDRYEGYVIDLLDELSRKLNFKYTIREVNDSTYGKEVAPKKWNGMIGEVMNRMADIAAADLTITVEREGAVEFTMPFMNTGISILYKNPTEKSTSLFSFLAPFSVEVWILVIAGYVTVSIVLCIVGRLSPYEWSNPHPCRQDDTIEENPFSFLDSMWFTIGSLLQQGSDLSPSSSSTRTIASAWYFFNLIIIASYTANLAAFLTVENTVFPFENVKELVAKQDRIKYGCLEGGSTQSFFKKSGVTLYQNMGKFMEKHGKEVFFTKKEQAEARVLQGDYAYFAEDSSIQYLVERQCEFTQIGGLLDTKGYGLAVHKENKKLAMWLTSGVLKLQEEGQLLTFKERWWKQKKGGGKCLEASKGSSSNALELANVGGVFVVMLLGFCIAMFVAVLEFIWYSRKLENADEEPLFKRLLQELKFAVSCGSSEKSAPKLRKDAS